MYLRLLGFLRCPDCGETLELVSLSAHSTADAEAITEPVAGAAAGRIMTVGPTLVKNGVSTTSAGSRRARRGGRAREGLLD
jgi:hypothetical protein